MTGSIAELVHRRYARSVAECLVRREAFTVDLGMPRHQWFRWKSGISAPCGCDCRRLNAFPTDRRMIGDALAEAVREAFPDVGYVIGAAHAGIPWATMLAERLDLPLAYVRTQPRAPGGMLVECAPSGAARAIVVDDVVASGASILSVIQAAQAETGLTVAGIQSIANWNFPEMRSRLNEWRVQALTSYPYLLDCAKAVGLLDDAGFAQLSRFYQDPRNDAWGW
jgi:orotate phosphoribosyltransferase